MKDKGGQYFDDLLHRSFFQKVFESRTLSTFVLHDLVHDLAEAVSGETRYLSSCCTEHTFDLDKNHGHDKRLSTIVVPNTCCFERIKSFGALRYLRVLDLQFSDIHMLPNDIGDLKYLHYINLTEGQCIDRLPDSLCNLHNLQSLILCGSGIVELPRGMKYLRNLQQLDLCYSEILSMPQGIGKLTNLKLLPFFVVSKDDGGVIRELKELSQLEGMLTIEIPRNVIDPSDAQEADLMNKKKVNEINFSWTGSENNVEVFESSENDVEVFESLRPHNELKVLKIFRYFGSTFPRWLMEEMPSYSKLVSLSLIYCTKCQVLPPIGELPLLEYLFLEDMHELKQWRSSGREETEFRSLLSLSISGCPKLEKLPEPLLSSPKLCELSFTWCPVLGFGTLPHVGLSRLTSLKNLSIWVEMEKLVQFLGETESLPPNINRIYIHDCTSLPKGLRKLSSLQHLVLGRNCKARYSPEELPPNVIPNVGHW